MIDYKEHTLANGLKVLVNHDRCSQMAAVNLLYVAGSVDEEPERSGFAHLFEHLMFRGTRRVPSYDAHVQQICGESNAFTSADYTDFYVTMPKENFEMAFWLEADRMRSLNISRQRLETEKSVVIEEFNQRYLNRPYAEQWHTLRSMVYTRSPYRWPVIGQTPDHIRNASLDDVKAFYDKFYLPSNAILSVSGDLDAERIFEAAERHFGALPTLAAPVRNIAEEPAICSARRTELYSAVPADQITIAFLMERRNERGYYLCDMLTDLLAGGESARLYQRLIKERQIFSATNAYITGECGQGMLILTGQLSSGVTIEQAEEALWGEIESLANEPIGDYELQKVKNKFEANITFGELNVMNKAMNLGYYRMLGDMSLLNGEVEIYGSITAAELADYVARNLRPEKSATLIYHRKND
ncbi:MAG: insulinase family protein [Tidjanibacter sp.]|nr:insulinase family protein [Tidjanibacter sp.]